MSAVLATDRERDLITQGFVSELLLIDDDFEPMGGAALKAYRIGERLGARCRKLVGSSGRAEKLLAEAPALREKARESHAAVVRSIKRKKLPRLTEQDLLSAAKLEPCASCRWIGICAATQMTCGPFRAYAGRNGGHRVPVPDKTWDESFPAMED